MSGQAHRGSGALERELFAALAAAGRPLTPAEALAALGRPLAYTTVMTTLARLQEKGALVRTPAGRSFTYALAVAPDTLDATLTARQMARVLDRGTNRAEALARFVADLGPDDERLLAELLRAQAGPNDHVTSNDADSVGTPTAGTTVLGSESAETSP
ncbi:BlaI/MecI/CopY family transcriptional regulator [Frankia sp. AgB1.9]|uniref:BlaI/MecI/CopY family transcriptional regulator n=1 Tax=unclassified Frankia TaxID=2632575 RepID=UPI0019346BE7|nr:MULTISPECIES: BlaI/MecI/CopY family transcriptional regulator [unclassified Frankia]MBL7492777.1 BlaI/MecI/CopY family transcriptional regulator [Frankia sp. AgW1.1]MBL7549292.1 BlaI/MecI/CopY family transcriptional regulator [Frankia sp. AgB1.9]MBL7619240.1 BlaI/MecI/CopY family transcriptional regulator [Frankia sp. AgB1.8]